MSEPIDIDSDGWLKQAHHIPSPNCDERPPEGEISLLVIHGISLPPNEFGGPHVEQLFCNTLNPDEHSYFAEIEHLRVSSHLFIRRDGELIQFVPLNQRAWHAGQSCFDGVERCNDFSIGIELEGADDIPYTDAQYAVLSEVTRALLAHFPALTTERIAGHCDIAPGRKTDPGPAFDWERYRAQMESL